MVCTRLPHASIHYHDRGLVRLLNFSSRFETLAALNPYRSRAGRGLNIAFLFHKYRALVVKHGGVSLEILYGLAIWGIVLSLGTVVGLVKSTGWQSGTGMMTTILAFLLYGIIAGSAASDVVEGKVRAG
jgi:hypothetical protein